MTDYPIDFVVPWVDGSDPVWQEEHNKYTADRNSDNSSARFRDWDTFNYWWRSIEKYAPWVNKVHLITFGHLPAWLNTDNPKLNIVRHEDYIPAEYLPTFSSHTIELNVHRIEGLAEHFVYFNDDVYLNAPAKPTDFFVNGKPVDTAVFGIVKNADTANFMPYIYLNMLAIINMRFPKREMLKRDFSKWITLKNGKGVLNNIYLLPWSTHTGFRNYHTCNPFCKSTFEEVWSENEEILDRTCRHKFRSREDVNQYLMRYWQLCRGNFVPHKPNCAYYTVGLDSTYSICQALKDGKYKVVCVNDDPMQFDFETEQQKIRNSFQSKFLEPSSFEKTND